MGSIGAIVSDDLLPVAAVLAILAGIILLGKGADWLVRGATMLAVRAGVTPLVIGLTVVACGTSVPELATSLIGGSTIAVGNVVGSNLMNLGLILGVTAVLMPLACQSKFLRFEVPFMVVGGPVMLWFCWDEMVGRLEGAILLLAMLAYIFFSVRRGRIESPADVIGEEENYIPRSEIRLTVALGLLALGLAVLTLGGRSLVWGAVEVAKWMHISERMIAVTVVAGGTSLPELATCLVAARRGQGDIALGNVVGSNIFNIFGILGTCAVVSPIAVPEGSEALDIPAMLLLQLIAWPIMYFGRRITRIEGVGLLGFYAAYVVILFMSR